MDGTRWEYTAAAYGIIQGRLLGSPDATTLWSKKSDGGATAWEQVEELGAKGWELVSVCPIASGGGGGFSVSRQLLFVFKRPKP